MGNNQNHPSGTFGVSIGSKLDVSAAAKEERRQIERRRAVRYSVSDTLEGVELQSKARFTGRTSDLSMGGCYVDTISALAVGSSLKIRITHDGKFFETKARVIASSASMGMSLMFTETESDQVKILEGWIRELSGDILPSEPELPEIKSQQAGEQGSNAVRFDALSELVTELMRTGVLSDLKGRAILRKLSSR